MSKNKKNTLTFDSSELSKKGRSALSLVLGKNVSESLNDGAIQTDRLVDVATSNVAGLVKRKDGNAIYAEGASKKGIADAKAAIKALGDAFNETSSLTAKKANAMAVLSDMIDKGFIDMNFVASRTNSRTAYLVLNKEKGLSLRDQLDAVLLENRKLKDQLK